MKTFDMFGLSSKFCITSYY